MYSMGIFNTNKFEDIFNALYGQMFDADIVEDEDMMSVLKLMEESSSAIKSQCSHILDKVKDIIDDFGELKHKTLLDNILDIPIKSGPYNNPCTSYFKHNILEPHCFLPGIKIPDKFRLIQENHVEENHYSACKNLEYGGMVPHGAHVTLIEQQNKGEIFANHIPKWVKLSTLRDKLARFSSSPDPKYPILKDRSMNEDNYYNVSAIYDGNPKYKTDALFASVMLTKCVITDTKLSEYAIISFRVSK